jgi:tRNA(adenine34) deaminase
MVSCRNMGQIMENNAQSHKYGHDFWMRKALKLARKAELQDEVPVGAVLVLDNKIVAYGFNQREKWQSPLGHAELICLHRASQKLNSWRLLNCTLYVTLEPCVMCAGAIVQSRISKIVFGANDPKGGAISSLYKITSDQRLNHQIDFVESVLKDECSEILKKFFKKKRLS